jgi:PAS domain S-box-containing protein
MEVVLPGPELAEGERHLLVMAYPVRGAGGAVSQVGVLAMDITARKVAQRRLQRSEERYRNLLQAGRDALLIYPIDENDRPGKFIEVNDAACARYGYTRAEMLRMDVTQIIARDIDVAAKIRSLVEAGQRIIQSVHRTASGELIPMEVSASVHEMDGGRFVMSNCRDISERVEAERALRESESRFRNLADSMPQIVWSAGVDGSVNYANRQWYEYSGLSSDIPLERAAWRAMHRPTGRQRHGSGGTACATDGCSSSRCACGTPQAASIAGSSPAPCPSAVRTAAWRAGSAPRPTSTTTSSPPTRWSRARPG